MNDYWTKPIGYTSASGNCYSFNWKIQNLCKDKLSNLSHYLTSPMYCDSCHKCNWSLKLRCQEKKLSAQQQWIAPRIFLSLVLVYRDESIPVGTEYYCRFMILDKQFEMLFKRDHICMFNSVANKCDMDFIDIRQLFDIDKSFVSDGTLIICCNVSTVKNQGYVTDNMFEFNRRGYHLTICNDLELFLQNKVFTDVTILTGQERLEAHKAVLASKSQVFLATFENNIQEKKEDVIEIKGFGIDVTKEMLYFIYTGTIRNIDNLAHQLLTCANEYSILGLKEVCAHYLGNTLTFDNVADILILADSHNCYALKSKISNFICAHQERIVNGSKFKEFLQLYPVLSNEVLCKILLGPQNYVTDDFKKKPTGFTDVGGNCYSFLWKIENLCRDTNPNINIKSPKFFDYKHGCTWSLELELFKTSSSLSLTLENKHVYSAGAIEYFYEFQVLDAKYKVLHKKEGSCVLDVKISTQLRFIGMNDLFETSKNFVSNGILIICCNMCTAQNRSYEEDDVEFDRGKHQIEACDNLEWLLRNKTLTDVTLITNEEIIEAHKIILASRSRVFLAMFENEMTEKQDDVVIIKDFSADVIKEFLYFIYTGKVKNIDEVAYELLSCADKYEVLDLKIICEQYLGSMLSLDNIPDTIVLADLHTCKSLKIKIINFVMSHKNILETPKFKMLLKSHPVAVNEILYKILLLDSQKK